MRKTLLSLLLAGALIGLCVLPACATEPEAVSITLSDSGVTVDGKAASTSPDSAVYVGGDIIYYHDGTDASYGEGTETEMHSAQEAQAHTVVTITQPGTYRLTGKLSQGQIFVDLGEDAKTDPAAVVTLILDGVDITCTVAPAVFFYRVYECDQTWVAYDNEELEDYTPTGTVDTSAAGANVQLAAGSTNTVTGSHVARIYKEGTTKKLHKYDGAFYSRMSMNIDGENGDDSGTLSIIADNEGLDSELHLTLNGGTVSIQSQDDGINTNEDGVSVTTLNGGTLTISAGLGAEGDGIDSNGFLTINGGIVWTMSNERSPDGGIDADCDITINGGTVHAFGTRNDSVSRTSQQGCMELMFASALTAGDQVRVTDTQGKELFCFTLERRCQSITLSTAAFTAGDTYYVYVNGIQQQYTGNQSGGFGGRPGGMEPPEGFDPSQMGQPPEGMEPPEGFDPGQKPEDMTPPEGFDPGQHPEGMTPSENGDHPGGTEPPEGFDPSNRPGHGQSAPSGEGSTDFTLTEAICSFSGVSSAPESAVTRAQAVVLLARLAGAEEAESGTFTDVPSDAWYSGYVGWAENHGIIQGDGQGHFLPDAPVTEEHLALMLTRLAASEGKTYTTTAAPTPLTYSALSQMLADYPRT